MQNKSKKRLGVTALALVAFMASMFLAGCQQGPSKPADQVIKDGMTKLMAVTSASYETAFKGDLQDKQGQEVKFDFTAGGQFDIKDPKDPKVTLKLSGSASDGKDMGGDGSLEMRLNKEALYFNVMQLNLLKGAGEVPKEVSDMFAKWWKMTLPPGTLDEMAASVPQGDESKMTPEQLKIKKLIEETNFFGSPKFMGTENVKGEDSYHYSVTLDKKALLDFMKQVAEAGGKTVSDTDLADAQKSLDMFDVSGDLYVGMTSGVLNKFSGTIKVTGVADSDPSGTITISVALGDMGKPVTLEVPQDATEFDPQTQLGPLLGAGATGAADLSGEMTGSTEMQAPPGEETMQVPSDEQALPETVPTEEQTTAQVQ